MTHVFNPGTTPVQITKTGRTLGGGEWTDVDEDALTKAALASGALVIPDTPKAAPPVINPPKEK